MYYPSSPTEAASVPFPSCPGLDLKQVERMLRLLYELGDWFALFTYPDHKGKGARRHDWFQMSGHVLDQVAAALDRENQQQPRGAALTVCTFDGSRSREAKNAVAVSALAVDIDRKNLDLLVPGVEEPERGVPTILALLDRRSLKRGNSDAITCASWWHDLVNASMAWSTSGPVAGVRSQYLPACTRSCILCERSAAIASASGL